jgi:CBS domain containing-hemolysin-like protein
MEIFYRVFYWPIRVLDWAGTRTVRIFGLHPSGEHGSIYTEEELRHLIDASHKSGHLEEAQQKLINRVFEFSDAEVREAMVPRTIVHALPLTAGLEEVKQAFKELGYSRLPVYREHLDNIVGVLHRRDLEPFLESPQTGEFNLEKILRPPLFVSAAARLGAALKLMQSSRTHLAFVMDEYGGIEGIVTLEDLLEEIVGEIDDEYDEEVRSQIVERDGAYFLDGMLAVRDANRHLKINIPEDDAYTTIAGFMLARAGRLLRAGDVVEFEGSQFTVERMDRRRIQKIRYVPAKQESPALTQP